MDNNTALISKLQARGWRVTPPPRRGAWARVEGLPIAIDELEALAASGLAAADAVLLRGKRKGAVAKTAGAAGARVHYVHPRLSAPPRSWWGFATPTAAAVRECARRAQLLAALTGGRVHHSPLCSRDSHYVLFNECVVRYSLHRHPDWYPDVPLAHGVVRAVRPRGEVDWARKIL